MGSAAIGAGIGLAVAGAIWFGGHEIHRLVNSPSGSETANSAHRPAKVG